MWITSEDEQRLADALAGISPTKSESQGYIKGFYCPRCGAQRVRFDFVHCYICNGYNRSVNKDLIRHVVCRHCHHGFVDSPEGRWNVRAWSSKSNLSPEQPIIPELLNPHDWRRHRQLIKEVARKYSQPKRDRVAGEFRSKVEDAGVAQ